MRITRFDRENADRLARARKGIPCPPDVPVEVDPDTGEVLRTLPGPEAMALVDIRRLSAAKRLEQDADQLAAHQRAGDTLTAAEQEDLARLRGLASVQREMVRAPELDTEDIVLRRGRHKPVAIHSPARPFASTTELQPTDRWVCPRCGAVYKAGSNGLCRRHDPPVRVQQLWFRPELAERWALVQARTEAREGVEYEVRVEPGTGVWLGTRAVLTGEDGNAAGFGALLEIAAICPTGPRDPYRITETRQAVLQAAAAELLEAQQAVFAAADRADELRAVEAEVTTHCRKVKLARDLVAVQALYGECETTAPTPSALRKKRTRRGKRGGGKGNTAAQQERRRAKDSDSPARPASQRAARKVLAVEADRKREGRYHQGASLGTRRSV